MQKSDEDVLKEKIALATNIALCAAIMVEFGAVSREEADQIIQDLFTSQKLARPTLDAEGLLEFEPQDVNRAQLTRIHKALKQDGRYVIAVQAKESADRERADQERERQKAADLAAANTQAEEEARRCQERARQRNTQAASVLHQLHDVPGNKGQVVAGSGDKEQEASLADKVDKEQQALADKVVGEECAPDKEQQALANKVVGEEERVPGKEQQALADEVVGEEQHVPANEVAGQEQAERKAAAGTARSNVRKKQQDQQHSRESFLAAAKAAYQEQFGMPFPGWQIDSSKNHKVGYAFQSASVKTSNGTYARCCAYFYRGVWVRYDDTVMVGTRSVIARVAGLIYSSNDYSVTVFAVSADGDMFRPAHSKVGNVVPDGDYISADVVAEGAAECDKEWAELTKVGKPANVHARKSTPAKKPAKHAQEEPTSNSEEGEDAFTPPPLKRTHTRTNAPTNAHTSKRTSKHTSERTSKRTSERTDMDTDKLRQLEAEVASLKEQARARLAEENAVSTAATHAGTTPGMQSNAAGNARLAVKTANTTLGDDDEEEDAAAGPYKRARNIGGRVEERRQQQAAAAVRVLGYELGLANGRLQERDEERVRKLLKRAGLGLE